MNSIIINKLPTSKILNGIYIPKSCFNPLKLSLNKQTLNIALSICQNRNESSVTLNKKNLRQKKLNKSRRPIQTKKIEANKKEISKKLMSYENSIIDEEDLSPKISNTQIKRKKRAINSNKNKTKAKIASNTNTKPKPTTKNTEQNIIKNTKNNELKNTNIENQNELEETENLNLNTDKNNLNKVMAYCTAEGYNISKLSSILNKNYAECITMTTDTLKVKLEKDKDYEAYIFSDGTVVSWGPSEQENVKLLNKLKKAEINRQKLNEYEWFNYIENNEIPGGMQDDIIYIGNSIPTDQAKLAFSTGLARSVKLSVFEDLLDQYLAKNRWIPVYLTKGKRLPLSRTQVLQRIGELFQLRGSANLYSDLLDTPDFCWSSDQLAEYFNNINRVLEIKPRMSIFNRKLDYANDMSSLMKSHLKERHNFKLEWIIILLLAIEVIGGGVHLLEKLDFINFDHWNKHYEEINIENVDDDSELLRNEKKYIEEIQ